MNNFILIADDEEDILEIHEFSARAFYKGDVVTCKSGNEALTIIQGRGTPILIISDYRMPNGDGAFLYNQIQSLGLSTKFVVCSGSPEQELKEKFPGVYRILFKPNIIKPLKILLQEIFSDHTPPQYVPISINQLLKIGYASPDSYLKVAELNYVKVTNKGDPFLFEDLDSYFNKPIYHLYLLHEEAVNLLYRFDTNSNLAGAGATAYHNEGEAHAISLEAISSIENLSTTMGWPLENIEIAKDSVKAALRAITDDPNVSKIIKEKLETSSHYYIALLCSLICYRIGWTNKSTRLKLSLAAFFRNAVVDDNFYKNHPIESAAFAAKMNNLPSEVETIILQHHERPDGQGFPGGLSATTISPLSALFIIVKDLVHYLESKELTKELILTFLVEKKSYYSAGTFRKVYMAFKASFK
jgi:CheY-like chemotaxis protein